MGFFRKDLSVGMDIHRHHQQETSLRRMIAELEDNPDEIAQHFCQTYRKLLAKLMESKAKVVDKIGRKG